MNPFLFRRIRGPVFLLCFALTALLNQWGILSWGQSWPLYILTAGLLRLVEAFLPMGSAEAAGWYPPVSPGAPPTMRYMVTRRSVTGGLVLLVVGTVALLLTTGKIPGGVFWSVFATWWPLLLIVIGLLLLVERLFDRGVSRRAGVPGGYVVRRRGSGIGWLIALVIVLGITSHAGRVHHWGVWNWDGAGQNWGENWGENWGSDWNWGDTQSNVVTLAEPLAAGATVTVDNARGDVQITPSSDGKIHVEAHQNAHVSKGEKSGVFEATKPVLKVEGGAASVVVAGRKNVSVRLVIALPDSSSCTVRDHHGDIAISDIKGAIAIDQDHGDVALSNLGGAARIKMDHGDVRARTVQGDLSIAGRADDVSLAGIEGKTTLEGEFFGDTTLDQVKGPVVFQSRRTQLSIGRLGGSLSLDAGDLRLTDVSGGLKISTQSKDIDVSGVSGAAEIVNSNGDVKVGTLAPLGPVSISNNTGDVEVSVPEGAAFSIDARTGKDDDISTAYGLTQRTTGDEKTLTGQVGVGGGSITIRNRHGDLEVKRGTPEVSKPEKAGDVRRLKGPAPPTPPVVE